jgi:hypothetical protein
MKSVVAAEVGGAAAGKRGGRCKGGGKRRDGCRDCDRMM